jgi:hypothetical protein
MQAVVLYYKLKKLLFFFADTNRVRTSPPRNTLRTACRMVTLEENKRTGIVSTR